MTSYSGALNKDAFISMLCQQSRSGRGVDARWCMQVWSVTKATAIGILDKLVTENVLTRTEVSWRGNAKKYYWYPEDHIWKKYHNKYYSSGYKQYLASLMRLMG